MVRIVWMVLMVEIVVVMIANVRMFCSKRTERS